MQAAARQHQHHHRHRQQHQHQHHQHEHGGRCGAACVVGRAGGLRNPRSPRSCLPSVLRACVRRRCRVWRLPSAGVRDGMLFKPLAWPPSSHHHAALPPAFSPTTAPPAHLIVAPPQTTRSAKVATCISRGHGVFTHAFPSDDPLMDPSASVDDGYCCTLNPATPIFPHLFGASARWCGLHHGGPGCLSTDAAQSEMSLLSPLSSLPPSFLLSCVLPSWVRAVPLPKLLKYLGLRPHGASVATSSFTRPARVRQSGSGSRSAGSCPDALPIGRRTYLQYLWLYASRGISVSRGSCEGCASITPDHQPSNGAPVALT